jgi:hypothetical protein
LCADRQTSGTRSEEDWKMRPMLLVAMSTALAACATSPIPTDQSKPASDVLNASMTMPRANTARVIIKRDPGFGGGACPIKASVGGKPLANLWPGELVIAYLDPGEHMLGAASTGICGGGDAEAAVVLKANDVRTYRISIDQGMSIRLGPTAY